jgi:hypothetical protein
MIHPTHGDVLLGSDDEDRFWVSFEDGASIAVWDGAAWSVYGPQAGWTSAGPIRRGGPQATVGEEIVIDGRGWTWIVTQKDVRYFDGEQWSIFSPEGAGFTPSTEMLDAGISFTLKDIALDSEGDVWVSDCAWLGPGPMGQGARWFTGDEWLGQNTLRVSSGCIEDIEVDSLGRIWLGVDGDLWRYDSWEGWEELAHPEHDPDWGYRWGWISDIHIAADDTAWVSMSPCGGASCDSGESILFTVRGDEWTFVSDEGPASVAFTDQGDGWMCLGHGLYRLIGAVPQLLFQLGEDSCQVEADAGGQVWLTIPGRFGFWSLAP